MRNSKVFATGIICAAIVFSVWLIEKNLNTQSSLAFGKTNTAQIVPIVPREHIESDNWKEVFSSTTSSKGFSYSPYSNTKDSDTGYAGEGTLTDQISKDFFAQYLIVKKNSGTVTTQDTVQIVQNTLKLPQYTQVSTVTYKMSNLNIDTQNTKTPAQYSADLNAIITKEKPQNPQDGYKIVAEAIKSNKPDTLKKLDPMITTYKAVISDLVELPVTKEAATLHLTLLNSVSNLLSDLEALRVTFDDPVKAFPAVSQYEVHIADFGVAVGNLNAYFGSKNVGKIILK
jgi:hypothetical protein